MINVIKTTVFVKDMNDFAAVNEVYASFFKKDPPTRSAVQVAALPKGAAIVDRNDRISLLVWNRLMRSTPRNLPSKRCMRVLLSNCVKSLKRALR